MIILAKKQIWFSLWGMTEDNLSIKDILEWYIAAGVEETAGSEPFALAKEIENRPRPVPRAAESVVRPAVAAASAESDERRAITELAQATINACKNARELCNSAQNLEELKQLVEKFDGCALKLTATKTVFGYGCPTARVVFIGEAPGADEDRTGIPFVGRSGHLLDKILQAAGLSREECFITNVLPWRPPGNRTPTTAEVAVCLPFLKRQIDLIKPDVLVLLGGSAANALLENEEPISRMRGKWLDFKSLNGDVIPVMATFHPAYLLRNAGQKAKIWSDFLRLKKKLT